MWMPSFAGARRRLFPKPLVILLVVNIQQDSFILYFKLCCSPGVAPEDGTAAYITLKCHDFGKDRAVEQNRVAADTFVRRDDNLNRGAAMSMGELIESFRANEWLVRQNNECGAYLRIERRKAGS
jgi:hypothetical protein